jgi:hypothetical protein
MATVDTSYVRRELRAIADTSQAIRSLLYKALETIEANPAHFSELEDVPERIRDAYPTVTWRKSSWSRDAIASDLCWHTGGSMRRKFPITST